MQPVVTGWSATRDVASSQCRIASPPLTVELLQVPDPLADSPEASLLWGDHIQREEQAEAAQAATPALVPSAPSVFSREAVRLRLDSTDRWPVLQDLDVITAVWSIRSGQASYTAHTLHQRSGLTSVVTESWPWFCFWWTRGWISATISARELCRAFSHSGYSVAEVHAEMMQLLDFFSKVSE